ncbi:hypothetical protein CLAFUW4_07277 [Fulvia fulva]|uniref:Uncharacterized protein n=1 Tax=Passalora fulva TaxID=5499 RepID=A0A9Q8UQI0_PASFU|nr:uncharacterized protein CLAFUR5_07408 [Fulvia fulva]KAK4621439.1 hypothetical protein CLAFUR4_07285 [Fulvia fulva]KAK4623360.1 hypothetical protein CLAFUR0_07283 [Fulvia fulva]UJO18730.1 hypothetical protein CLAFUR5_07408 [Fulvia fulva]WPV16610.1 hypothetical protein CLAFUW4_07277 [Fulvia fulva]WPV30914.1 hypothetical protein CLAFUW7_07279 [Fulvia fulva]
MSLYTPVSPRDLYRQQFLMHLLHMHSKGDSIALFHNSGLSDMPNIEISSPAVQAALDTLCYVGLGTAYQDRNLLSEARIRYSSAIKLLSLELNVAPKKTRFRAAVSSMMILRLRELFDTLAHSTKNDRGWHLHLHAVQQYMKACGPEDLLKTEYDWKLFQTVRFCSLYLDIARRRASMFERPEWRALTRVRAKIDPGVALYDLRARVPRLLARADAVMESTTLGEGEVRGLLGGLYRDQLQLRGDFQDWMETFGKGYETRLLPRDSNLSTTTSDPFDTYYHFKSVSHASQCTTYWMLSLTLDSSILRLLDRYPSFPSPHTSATLSTEAYTTALNLYRASYWCCQPEVAQSPYVGTFHLEFARAYFERAGYWEEVEQCERMMESVKLSFALQGDEAGRVESLLAALSQKAAADRFSRGVLTASGVRECQEKIFRRGE